MLTISFSNPGREGRIQARIAQVPSLVGEGQTKMEAYRNVIEALARRWTPKDGPRVKEVLGLLTTDAGVKESFRE